MDKNLLILSNSRPLVNRNPVEATKNAGQKDLRFLAMPGSRGRIQDSEEDSVAAVVPAVEAAEVVVYWGLTVACGSSSVPVVVMS